MHAMLSAHHQGQHQSPAGLVHHRQSLNGPPDLPDIKPLLESGGFDPTSVSNSSVAAAAAAQEAAAAAVGQKPSSAFMPLTHSYPGSAAAANMMNSGVASGFPFGVAPRLPPTTAPLNSPLGAARLSPPVVNNSHYFPFSRGDALDGRMDAGMISSLLRIQQLRDFSSAVFPKSEASLSAAAAVAGHKDAYSHKDYAHKDYT